MPASGGCLLECLKEAHLESYYSSFLRHGILKCEGLANLSMHEYSRFGVQSMEDRVRLFKLVQIVKSVLADGLHCQHEYPAEVRNRFSIPKATTTEVQTKPIVDRPSRQGGPNVHVVNHKAGQRQKTAAGIKAPQNHTKGSSGGVQYIPGSDTPIFKCRKVLTFSDSEDEEDSKNKVARDNSNTHPIVATVKPTNVISRRNDTVPEAQVNSATRQEFKEPKVASVKRKPPQKFFVNFDAPSPKQTPVETSANISDIVVHADDRIDSGNNTASSPNRTASSLDKRQGGYSSERGSKNGLSFELNPTDLSSYSTDSVGRKRPVSSESGVHSRSASSRSRSSSPPKQGASHCSFELDREYHHSEDNQQKSSEPHTEEVPMELRSPRKSPSRPANAFFVDAHTGQGQHAYFPQFQPPSRQSEPRVETIVHNSQYNYGVPGPASPRASRSRTGSIQFTSASRSKSVASARNRDARIRVCVRKRPQLKKEVKRQEADIVSVREDDAVVVEESKLTIDLSKYIQQHVFAFDEAFGSSCSNHDVYEGTAKPLVQHVIQGGCGTCFAFGQTGAGKTYTLLGDKNVPGLYQLAARDIFLAASAGQWGREVHLWLSYYEIYCGQLYDLLNKRKRLTVRENGRQKVCIAGLMETEVKNFSNLINAVEYGNNVRSTGNTGVNPKSSRSHAVLALEVRDRDDHLMGKLSFIDLAGSERASDITEFNKQTRIEGAEINQSLLALKECIRSLDQQEQHTPYRQSKLTHILRDSFLGNSKTCMIANISPTQSACENTLNTLRYADRVKELRRDEEGAKGAVQSQSVGRSTDVFSSTEAGPSLFHPSTIQGSSTPKKKNNVQQPDKLFDMNKALHDAYESPIRGHKFRKLTNKRRSESSIRGIELSPHRSSSAEASSRPSRNTESKSDRQSPDRARRTTSQDSLRRSGATVSSRENSNERPSINPDTFTSSNHTSPHRKHSAGRWSHGPHVDNHFEASVDTQPLTSHDFASVQDKIRKEDILNEHKQILSHLDSIMLRAKAAVAKSTEIEKEMLDVASAPTHGDQTNDNPVLRISQNDGARNSTQVQQGPFTPSQHPSSKFQASARESEHRSPMTDQLRLAQAQLKTQQEILKLQEQQIHMRSQGYRPIESASSSSTNVTPRFVEPHRNYNNSQDRVNLGYSTRSVDHQAGIHLSDNEPQSVKSHIDDRKPKLSNDISKVVHKNYEVVLPKDDNKPKSGPHENTSGTDGLEKSLPSAEEFLKSLAEMRLNKQSGKSDKKSFGSNSKLNPEQLAQLGEHFERLGIDTRPFQDLLGSPSNTRGSSSATTFQPVERGFGIKRQLSYPERPVSSSGSATTSVERASDVKRQLSYPERPVSVPQQQRAIADGEENLVKTTKPAVLAHSSATTDASSGILKAKPGSLTLSLGDHSAALLTTRPLGATANVSAEDKSNQGAATFTPIESHPVTNPVKPQNEITAPNTIKVKISGNGSSDEDSGRGKSVLQRQVSGETNPPSPTPSSPGPGESLSLDISRTAEQHSTAECNDRHDLGTSVDESGEILPARGDNSSNSNESPKQRARQLLITAHEDQLAEITNLCKHEMKLLKGVKMGDQSFDEYIQTLRSVLSSKAHCVATLNSQIQKLETLSPAASNPSDP